MAGDKEHKKEERSGNIHVGWSPGLRCHVFFHRSTSQQLEIDESELLL